MSNEDVLEHSGQQEESSVDIADLLEMANSKVFDDQDGLTDKNKNFEKKNQNFDKKIKNFEKKYIDIGSYGTATILF